jgi:hypothetical protein
MRSIYVLTGLFAISLMHSVYAQTVPSRETLTIDCNIGEGVAVVGDDHALMPGEVLTVTLLNCDGWNVDDRGQWRCHAT